MTHLLAILALVLSACTGAAATSTTTTSTLPHGPDADSVVLIAELTGGCAMMGPNCERFVIYGDGTVEAYRAGESDPRPTDTGSIDPALAATLHRAVTTTDLDALKRRLPPGECQSCFDGIDTLATVTVDGAAVTFSSVDTEFTPSEPVFVAMWDVINAARDATEIPLITR